MGKLGRHIPRKPNARAFRCRGYGVMHIAHQVLQVERPGRLSATAYLSALVGRGNDLCQLTGRTYHSSGMAAHSRWQGASLQCRTIMQDAVQGFLQHSLPEGRRKFSLPHRMPCGSGRCHRSCGYQAQGRIIHGMCTCLLQRLFQRNDIVAMRITGVIGCRGWLGCCVPAALFAVPY